MFFFNFEYIFQKRSKKIILSKRKKKSVNSMLKIVNSMPSLFRFKNPFQSLTHVL